MAVEIKEAPIQQVRHLRQKLLRPNQTIEQCIYPGDELASSKNFGGFAGDELVAIASVAPENLPDVSSERGWRIRGMACQPELRNTGIGSLLLKQCIDYCLQANADWIWCNARTPAMRFYQKQGFKTLGNEFELPGIGPHFVMVKKLT